MAPATQFFQYWGLAFITLGLTLVLLNLFYRFIDSDLQLHSLRKEAVIAGIASAVQGAGYWLLVSFFPRSPLRAMIVPAIIVAIIYFASHLEDWNGYETAGIALFQVVILTAGLCFYRGDFKLALILLGVLGFGLVIIASIAKSL